MKDNGDIYLGRFLSLKSINLKRSACLIGEKYICQLLNHKHQKKLD